MAVTFTNKAAAGNARARRAAARARIAARCGCRRSTRCARACCGARRHNIGLSRDFTIYDSADQQAVIKQLLKDYHLDDRVVSAADGARAASATPRTAWRARRRFANTWNPKDREIGKLFEGYIKALKNASALDFDDLLLATVELFDQDPAVRERYAHKLPAT